MPPTLSCAYSRWLFGFQRSSPHASPLSQGETEACGRCGAQLALTRCDLGCTWTVLSVPLQVVPSLPCFRSPRSSQRQRARLGRWWVCECVAPSVALASGMEGHQDPEPGCPSLRAPRSPLWAAPVKLIPHVLGYPRPDQETRLETRDHFWLVVGDPGHWPGQGQAWRKVEREGLLWFLAQRCACLSRGPGALPALQGWGVGMTFLGLFEPWCALARALCQAQEGLHGNEGKRDRVSESPRLWAVTKPRPQHPHAARCLRLGKSLYDSEPVSRQGTSLADPRLVPQSMAPWRALGSPQHHCHLTKGSSPGSANNGTHRSQSEVTG